MRGGRSARGLFPRKRRDLLIITWRRNKFSYQIIFCCSFFVWVRAKRSQMQDMNPDWKRGLWGKKKTKKKQTDVDTWQPEVSLCLEKAEQNEMNLAFNCLFMCVNTREGQLWWRVPRNLARSLERKGDPSSCWLTRSVYKLWLTSVHSVKCPPLKIIFFLVLLVSHRSGGPHWACSGTYFSVYREEQTAVSDCTEVVSMKMFPAQSVDTFKSKTTRATIKINRAPETLRHHNFIAAVQLTRLCVLMTLSLLLHRDAVVFLISCYSDGAKRKPPFVLK